MVLIPILIRCAYLEEYGTHSNTEEVCLFGVLWYSFQFILNIYPCLFWGMNGTHSNTE